MGKKKTKKVDNDESLAIQQIGDKQVAEEKHESAKTAEFVIRWMGPSLIAILTWLFMAWLGERDKAIDVQFDGIRKDVQRIEKRMDDLEGPSADSEELTAEITEECKKFLFEEDRGSNKIAEELRQGLDPLEAVRRLEGLSEERASFLDYLDCSADNVLSTHRLCVPYSARR